MKKIIVFICVIAVAITMNSCKKRVWYACCDTGHPHWEGLHKYGSSDEYGLTVEEDDHDKNVHGSVKTASRCSTR